MADGNKQAKELAKQIAEAERQERMRREREANAPPKK